MELLLSEWPHTSCFRLLGFSTSLECDEVTCHECPIQVAEAEGAIGCIGLHGAFDNQEMPKNCACTCNMLT